MSGAYSKPMPWSGGGSTKPPLANNYLDSHGLNPGLGCGEDVLVEVHQSDGVLGLSGHLEAGER